MTDLAERPTALYRFFDADDRLLYAGIAVNPPARWQGHKGEKDWWYTATRATLTWYDNRADAEKAEAEAIATERPLHNRKLRHYGRVESNVEVMSAEEVRKVLGQRLSKARDEGMHTAVARHGVVKAVIVPIDWYQRVRQLDGDRADL
ncbi:GIY-YIG nuclease family protein [Micromonospora chersina]|uniref:GIY-YIG nuclease family protein n=1 Tax=Micromonospora chersina TaxID=47854 RepID=UPI00371D2BE3